MGERGDVNVQAVLTVPIVVLLVLLCVQAAVWYHAANVAQSAAARGASVGSAYGAGYSAAVVEAGRVVAENGAALVGSPAVSTSTGEITVGVTVAVPRVVPFFPATVTRRLSEPRERFIPEGER